MKHNRYDAEFYQYTDEQMERVYNLLASIEYDTMMKEYISSIQQQINNCCYQDEIESIASSIKSSSSSKKSSDSKSIIQRIQQDQGNHPPQRNLVIQDS